MSTQSFFSPADRNVASSGHAAAGVAREPSPRNPTVKQRREPWLKRPLDFFLSLIMLVFSTPLLIILAIAIRFEDGGPIFYRQLRWGRFGRKFTVFKFRTMVPDSDKKFGLKQAEENDPRITPVGRILRATGLDELPQLICILLGEMSFVGPRALAIGEIIYDEKRRRVSYENTPGFSERMAVRPGLTSLATVHLHKDASARRKFRYDLYYIRKQSFALDIWLIALSFYISFRGKWETRQRKV